MSAQDEGAAVAGYWTQMTDREARTVVGWQEDLPTGMVSMHMEDGSIKVIPRHELKDFTRRGVLTFRIS